MSRFTIVFALLFSGSAFADGCDFVKGTWRIDRFDELLQSQIEVEVVFAEDGGLRAITHANDGTESTYYEDWGEWNCENGVVEVSYRSNLYGLEGDETVYLELQEANNSFLGFREIREDSDAAAERQAVRVSESSYIHCC